MRRNGWKIDLFPIDIEFEMVYNIERVKKYKPVDIKLVKRHGIFFSKYALKCKVIEDDY